MVHLLLALLAALTASAGEDSVRIRSDQYHWNVIMPFRPGLAEVHVQTALGCPSDRVIIGSISVIRICSYRRAGLCVAFTFHDFYPRSNLGTEPMVAREVTLKIPKPKPRTSSP